MSLGRRLALLEWAEQAGAWILEDDYDSEFRFGGRPLEALQGLDRTGRVLYVGTFSKALFPALRLGFLVAPADLVEPLLTTRRFADAHLPILEQLALADFMAEGHFARHLQRMRERYRQRATCCARSCALVSAACSTCPRPKPACNWSAGCRLASTTAAPLRSLPRRASS